MRSRPDAGRRRFESACRLGVFALLGWMLGTAFFPVARFHTRSADADALGAALPAWTFAPRSELMDLTLRRSPTRLQLAWLAALERAGRFVAWRGGVPAAAVSAEPVAGPDGATRLAVAAPDSSPLRLRDSLGDLDSLMSIHGGVSLVVPRAEAPLTAVVGDQPLVPAAAYAASARPILVVGAAGWESKFTAAALEESGWRVYTRFAAAPGVIVGNAAGVAVDTAHLSAIVALDTTIDAVSGVARFVRDGGGLVLAGDAPLAPNVASLATGRPGVRVPAALTVADTLGLASAGYVPIAGLRSDAEVVTRRGRDVVMAARRVGAGRVVQVGYDETWRWRMAGGPESVSGHREWWSRLASAVAHAEFATTRAGTRAEYPAMSRAAVVDAVGDARPSPTLAGTWSPDPRWLLAIIFLLLLAEWASRRTRGAR